VIEVRVRVVAGGVAVVAIGASIGAVALSQDSGKAATASSPVSTAEVVRTDLVSRTDVDGTLGWSHTYTVSADGNGRLTWLPSVGDTINQGKRVYEVDGHPVPLLHGSTPFWRTLRSGVDEGADVEELETNLKALGYGSDLTVDKSYTSATATAVKKWQADLGVSQTGVVAPGDAVVEPGDLLISAVKADLGSAAHGPVLTATDTARQVTVDIPVTQQELAVVGGVVRIKLPGGKTTTGKISSVGTTASAGKDSSGSKAQTGQGTETATIPVYITLDDASAAGKLDGAPVTVGFTSAAHKGVLAVPVNALLANADGTYGVEAVDGTRRWLVPVQLGIFADGKVEVTGPGLIPGMRVEVPKP
jgi:peptidoglycan hydrolase-like protein with peptidoglycan-binding domain